MVATGNYSSSLFGTSVSEIDGALVARFANYFQEEPTMEDIDSYLKYFVETVLNTVNLSKVDEKLVEAFRESVLNEKFRDLLFRMFYVSGRSEALRAFREKRATDWGESEDPGKAELKNKAPFPSPREISHFFLNRLLPLWLPQSAVIHDQDGGVDYETLSGTSVKELTEKRALELEISLSKNRALSNPYQLAKQIFHAGLGMIPKYPVPGVTKALFHPFSGVVLVPEPSKEVFPNLYEELKSMEEAKSLLNADFQDYDSISPYSSQLPVGEKKLWRTPLLLGG